jgi:polysaccharide biosynthesis protein PelD
MRVGGRNLSVLPPRFALVELLVFALIIAAEVLWEPFPDISRLNPNPYWIPVLLLSLQYGTVSGLLAAALAIAGTQWLGMPEQDIGESYFTYLIRIWAQPILWLVAALFLGSFRMRQLEQRDDLLGEVEDLNARAEALAEHTTLLKTRCDQLERRLASGASTAADQMLDALAALGSGAQQQWPGQIETALRLVAPEAQASVFTLDDGRLQLVFSHDWSDDARWHRNIEAGEMLAQSMRNGRPPLSILNAADENVLAGEGVFALPLRAPGSGDVIGMLKVESLPAEAITAATLRRLETLACHLPAVLPTLKKVATPRVEPSLTRSSAITRFSRWRSNEKPAAAE